MTDIYILGGSQTDFARNWAREGKDIYDMFSESLQEAVANAAIEPGQIEVGHVGNFVGELFTGQGLLGGFFGQVYPELAALPTSRHEAACASGSIAIMSAMRDIEAGHYDVACALGLELMRNTDGKTGAEYLGAAAWKGHEATPEECDFPWPHMFDRLTEEYDHRYGINADHLNRIAEINFANGRLNPRAQTREWDFPEGAFTCDDTLNPVIEGRVRKQDCGQITDGAACVILASERAARQHADKLGLQLQDIPRIKGWGHRSAPILLSRKLELSADAPLVFPHAAQCLAEAAQRAGFAAVAELDGLETHDCFSMTEYMAIDHAGLTAPGESWKAVEEGRITLDGDFPINASGGLIGLGHPVGATGIRMVLDCARQVTGRAGPYQMPRAENMITFNVGGSTTTCASFVVGVGS
ncbi:acetyl-CoA acetyltransferase [Halioglobus japonicus]|uniref:Acetyl-CoA acetyltransferase n=1 Tax=Halioglobus japonicus TaxID=930805 RepID=A0AAP8MD50_9GAMM|nr:acetyl-CoA acetyltransferase [Halioglobus japonicus]AQA17650.1 acetyl-CoA acetyltransferase [Halioglobus japonicus]PLW85595.1 acetyl-CoA acetyltransferase [Halioglobus japonicus]GHD16451.1 acetyl-CoA acetyltransferase [Halioglobus japonicus]